MKKGVIGQKNHYFFIWLIVFFAVWNPSNLMSMGGKNLKINLKNMIEFGRQGITLESIETVGEDKTANVYILDRRACKVHKFSDKGNLILSFGQKGEGPGDFFNANSLAVTDQGNIVICQDMTFVSYFNAEGKFIKKIQIPNCLGLVFVSDNIFYGWQWTEKGKKQFLINRQGKIIRSFYEVLRNQFSISAADETGRMVMSNYSTPEYTPTFFFSFSGKYALIGISNDPKVFIVDDMGAIIKTIQSNRKPATITSAEREWLAGQINNRTNLHDFAMPKRSL